MSYEKSKNLLSGQVCWTFVETVDGEYEISYDKKYVGKFPDCFLTFTMPVSRTSYRSDRLFPLRG